MITLLKNLECYCPEYVGKKDILISQNKIYKMVNNILNEDLGGLINIVDCDGLHAFPGIIDGHVHLIGGGGESGFQSRIDEINFNDIISSGITTVVGLLGADNVTKSMVSLLAKARGLEQQGITTYIYSGSYSLPLTTITKNITTDMVLIDKVIGAGEVAIADHRSSNPNITDLMNLSTQTHLGALLSGKVGLVHIHVGDGKSALNILNRILEESDLPIDMFLPTHTNRSRMLFNEAIKYAQNGGNIDLTSGETEGISIADAIQEIMGSDIDLNQVTISSDANGSVPSGVGNIRTLFDDVISCITQKDIKPEVAFSLVTKNVAERLKIYPQKGSLSEGSDADILILDNGYNIKKLYSMGELIFDSE